MPRPTPGGKRPPLNVKVFGRLIKMLFQFFPGV